MRLIHRLLVLLFLREAFAAVARKPPAFSKPVYSSAYLPAAMQVIFHAVEQLKANQAEETTITTTTIAATTAATTAAAAAATTIAAAAAVAITTSSISSSVVGTNQETTLSSNQHVDNFKETELMEMAETVTETTINGDKITTDVEEDRQESPETHEETPEMNYATPETNYERPEISDEFEETNQEHPETTNGKEEEEEEEEEVAAVVVMMEEEKKKKEEEEEEKSNVVSKTKPAGSPTKDSMIKDQPSIDSIVEGIYEIIRPTSTEVIYDDLLEDDYNGDNYKKEKIEEEDDENRFTMLGEKVTQVPRPSLSNYLKRVKGGPRASLVQLASLYDALGKDARKQGYGKYFGYSDEVLRVLDTSAEGGAGPQLKKLLDKILERNELTREDARNKTKLVIRDLEEPASLLNKDLRNVLPLRFSFS